MSTGQFFTESWTTHHGQYHWKKWVSHCPSDFVYVCMCDQECVGRGGQQVLSYIAPLPYFPRHGLSLNLEPSDFLRLVGQQVPGCPSSLAPQLLNYIHAPPYPASFMWVLGFELNSLCLHEKHFAHWTIFPATSIVIFLKNYFLWQV